jgi:Flp pilus assembly pilin Flp
MLRQLIRNLRSWKDLDGSRGLRRGEQGQDLVEYTLLLALIVLATSALLIHTGTASRGVWGSNNEMLTRAQGVANGQGDPGGSGGGSNGNGKGDGTGGQNGTGQGKGNPKGKG